MRLSGVFAILAAALSSACLFAQSPIDKAMSVARQYEVREMEKPPWAERPDRPRLRMAWLSDMHLGEPGSIEAVREACRTIRNILRPDFTLVTGDNSGYYADMSREEMELPEGERRNLWCRRFLDKELGVGAYEIIPGDNWPWGFEKAFGPSCRSFDYGGVHFVLASTGRLGKGEGCTAMTDDAMKWIENDLAMNKGRPVFFAIHQPVWPPFFIDSMRLGAVLEKHGQVLAVFCGHLHLDLDFSHGGMRHIICPSVGRSHRPAFKHALFYDDAVVLESYERDPLTGQFRKASKWQKIDMPERLSGAMGPPAVGPAARCNYSLMKAVPCMADDSLDERSIEIGANLMKFILQFGMNGFLGTRQK